jgi:proteasome assembly chaperone (PAC2) family protein
MEHLRIKEIPDLRDPALIMAFSGWNDAGEAATRAARYLVRRSGAVEFADIDPEDFYVFTSTRPTVRMPDGRMRKIEWPSDRFYYCRSESRPRDLIIFVGVEPDLHWRTFTEHVLGLAKQCGVTTAITLGALLADVPHTRPVRVSGTAYDEQLATRLNMSFSRYEGPTGIVGITHDALHRSGLPSISLWANVPHYITASPNPRAALALLNRLNTVLHLDISLGEMERRARVFDAQVAEAMAGNPEIAAYVSQLEERSEADMPGTTDDTASELPSGEALIADLEDFLRQSRQDGGTT